MYLDNIYVILCGTLVKKQNVNRILALALPLYKNKYIHQCPYLIKIVR